MTNTTLDAALHSLGALTDADDLRWLSAHIGLEKLDLEPELRGIDYYGHSRGGALAPALAALPALTPDELVTLRIVVDLLHRAISPITEQARGTVQIKTQTRKYAMKDPKTGVPVTDENGEFLFETYTYPYAYVRLYAGKGDADHKRAKLLSLYADRGSGTAAQGGGFGGYVARALDEGLITKNDVLDAWHEGATAYAAFVDNIETLVKSGKLTKSDTLPNLSSEPEPITMPEAPSVEPPAVPELPPEGLTTPPNLTREQRAVLNYLNEHGECRLGNQTTVRLGRFGGTTEIYYVHAGTARRLAAMGLYELREGTPLVGTARRPP